MVEELLFENLTECDDHDEVRLLCPDLSAKEIIRSLFRLKHLNAMLQGKLLHGRRGQLLPPPLGPVRLRDNARTL